MKSTTRLRKVDLNHLHENDDSNESTSAKDSKVEADFGSEDGANDEEMLYARRGRHRKKVDAKLAQESARVRVSTRADAHVKLRVERTPWSQPPNRNFPRAHFWSWEDQLGGDQEFEKEFEKVTSMTLVGAKSTPETSNAAAANHDEDDIIRHSPHHLHMGVRDRGNGTDQQSMMESNNNNDNKQVSSRSTLLNRYRRLQGEKNSKDKDSNASSNPYASRRLKRTSMRQNNGNGIPQNRRRRRSVGMVQEKTKSTIKVSTEGERTPAARHIYEEKLEFEDLETPTPPPMVFNVEGALDCYDDAYDAVLAEQERHQQELRVSSLDTFINACYESSLLPEPLLNTKRAEQKAIAEASKRHENLAIKTKRDIEKMNSREVVLWDWQHVAKVRTPDELKLEYYGMGDQYMPAMAKGLEVDAAHANKGKRAIQRFNLSSCRITGRGLEYLARGLAQHSKALKLDLSNNSLGPNGLSPLAKLYENGAVICRSLLVLDLSGNGLSDRNIVQLFAAIKESSLEWLNLSTNEIGGQGALAIANFVETQQPGFQQDMNYCHELFGECKSDGGVRYHYSPLKTLILDWNKIRGMEACKLIQAFEKNRIVNELSISWNGFGNQPECAPYLLALIRNNEAIKTLAMTHNCFNKTLCEDVLEAMCDSKSLLSVDLSGNDPHENIFLREDQKTVLHEIVESWLFDETNLIGNTRYIYTRYSTKQSAQQRRMSIGVHALIGENGNDLASEESTNQQQQVGESLNDSPSRRRNSIARAEAQKQINTLFDQDIWKRREVCWLKHRWMKHTFWYYPGISGPPSNEVYLLVMLQGGAAFCIKMKPAPSKQTSGATNNNFSARAAAARSEAKGPAKQGTKMKLLMKSKRSSANLLGGDSRLASTPRGNGMQRNKTRSALLGSSPLHKRLATQRKFSQNHGVRKEAGEIAEDDDGNESSGVVLANRSNPTHLGQKIFRQQKRTNKAIDYSGILGSFAGDTSSLGKVITKSLYKTNMEQSDDEIMENLKLLSLEQDEIVCPYFATIMVPPGRVQYKFIVQGEQIFARDQDCCWACWPNSTTQDKKEEVNELSAQRIGTVVNCLDVKWPNKPVCDLANPDPGSERDQPTSLWSIHKSIFRYHPCDTHATLTAAFAADYEKLLENSFCVKAMGDDKDLIRELLWAHYPALSTVFTLTAATGSNSFALSFEEIEDWVRRMDVVASDVDSDLLFEVFDRSAMVESRSSTNRFGKHYSFMVRNPNANATDRTACVMLRPQFLQFLVLLATSLYAPTTIKFIARRNTRKLALEKPIQESSGQSSPPPQQEDCENKFQAVHKLIRQILMNHRGEYIHRDVFRRGNLFFQDVVNVFLRNMDYLRKLFDTHSVKGHVLHDFIPSNVWMEIFLKIDPGFSNLPLHRIFAQSKNTFIEFGDIDFAPGLCFLEFLECLARLAKLKTVAKSVVNAFEERRKTRLSILADQAETGRKGKQDNFAKDLETLIDQFKTKIPL